LLPGDTTRRLFLYSFNIRDIFAEKTSGHYRTFDQLCLFSGEDSATELSKDPFLQG